MILMAKVPFQCATDVFAYAYFIYPWKVCAVKYYYTHISFDLRSFHMKFQLLKIFAK